MPLRNGGLKVKRLRQLDRKSKPKIVVGGGWVRRKKWKFHEVQKKPIEDNIK